MKIVALSDTHTLQDQVVMPEGQFDILIHAGDMGNMGYEWEYAAIGNWFHKYKSQFKYQIIVPGNHDAAFQSQPEITLHHYFDEDVICLIDKGVEIEGFKFYGCPWMPQFYNWAFMMPESELPAIYAKIPDDTEVLITHCPPYGILDNHNRSGSFYDRRCGSLALYNRVKQLPELKHHIFGHIHAGAGTETIDGITFHNVAALNENYRYQNAPQIIEL